MGCRYHLALELRRGTLALGFGDVAELRKLADTCALDVADRGEHTGPDVAKLLGVSRQLISRLEQDAVRKLAVYFQQLPRDVVRELLPMLVGMGLGGDA